jgi:ATP-binding cassette subfamily F protein uup
VVTSTLVFEGDGKVGEYAGGYEDWERYRQLVAAERPQAPRRTPLLAAAPVEKRRDISRKLSYKEERELEALPGKIELLEAEQSRLHRLMGAADFYRQPADRITAAMERLKAIAEELAACYERWEVLESDR